MVNVYIFFHEFIMTGSENLRYRFRLGSRRLSWLVNFYWHVQRFCRLVLLPVLVNGTLVCRPDKTGNAGVFYLAEPTRPWRKNHEEVLAQNVVDLSN